MPFPSAHQRIVWFGDGWTQQEEWSTGLRVNGTVPPTAAQLEALDNAFAPLMNSLNIFVTNSVRYLGVKVAPQDVNGLYGVDGQARERLRETPIIGGGQGGLPQATIVATLTTATPRGLANEGRMYLPATGRTAGADGRIAEGMANGIRQDIITFIAAVEAVGIGTVSIFSKGTPTQPGGAVRDVTGVRIGRVIDTQRRRRNSIAELYVSGAVGN